MLSPSVVSDNISILSIRYTEPVLRFRFPEIYTSSWNSASPITVTLSKSPTLLRLL